MTNEPIEVCKAEDCIRILGHEGPHRGVMGYSFYVSSAGTPAYAAETPVRWVETTVPVAVYPAGTFTPQPADDVTVAQACEELGLPDPHDPVNAPRHYKHPSGREAIELTELYPFNRGNALKYLWRRGSKGTALQDVEKARWYVNREIENLSGDEVLADWLKHEPDGPVRRAFQLIAEAELRDLTLARAYLDEEITRLKAEAGQ